MDVLLDVLLALLALGAVYIALLLLGYLLVWAISKVENTKMRRFFYIYFGIFFLPAFAAVACTSARETASSGLGAIRSIFTVRLDVRLFVLITAIYAFAYYAVFRWALGL